MSELITIDCGGTLLKTTRSTLCKIEFFKSYLARWTKEENIDAPLFIDQDPNLFKHILNSLRLEAYVVPSDMIENVNVLADYYCLELPSKKKLLFDVVKSSHVLYHAGHHPFELTLKEDGCHSLINITVLFSPHNKENAMICKKDIPSPSLSYEDKKLGRRVIYYSNLFNYVETTDGVMLEINKQYLKYFTDISKIYLSCDCFKAVKIECCVAYDYFE